MRSLFRHAATSAAHDAEYRRKQRHPDPLVRVRFHHTAADFGHQPGERHGVSYTYNADGTVATKIDAKGNKEAYTYDSYQRLTAIHRYPGGVNEDLCQLQSFSYEWNLSGPACGSRFWPAGFQSLRAGHFFSEAPERRALGHKTRRSPGRFCRALLLPFRRWDTSSAYIGEYPIPTRRCSSRRRPVQAKRF